MALEVRRHAGDFGIAFGQHHTGRIDDQRTAAVLVLRVASHAIARDDERLVLDGAGDQQAPPVARPLRRPACADREDLGARKGRESPEFGEAKVVADERADREPARFDDQQSIAAAVDAVFACEGEGMDLVVGAEDLAIRRDHGRAIATKAFGTAFGVAELDVPASRARQFTCPRDAVELGDPIEIETEARVAQFRQQQEGTARQIDRVECGLDRRPGSGRILPRDVVLQARETHRNWEKRPIAARARTARPRTRGTGRATDGTRTRDVRNHNPVL